VLRQMPGHPNIVRLIKAIESSKRLYIMMELCAEGDLSQFLSKRGGRLCEKDARYVIRHVLRGLCFMNDKCNLMHRDVKLENILVKRKGSGTQVRDFEFKLADMGLAKGSRGKDAIF